MKRLILAAAFLLALSAPAHASIVCDGTNYLTATANAAYGTSTWSMSLWVKKAGDGTLQPLAGGSLGSGFAGQILVTNAIRGRDVDGTTVLDASDTVTGTGWHHIVWTYNGGTGEWFIYYDNDLTPATGTSGLQTQSASNAEEICRTSINFVVAPVNTKIALVAHWNTVLTSGNVASLNATCSPESVATASNIASWKLTNGSLTDSSATANNMTNPNSLAGSTDEPTPCVSTDETFGFYKRRPK